MSKQDWFVRPVVVWEVIGRGHRRATDRVDTEGEAMRMASALARTTGGGVLQLNQHGKVVKDGS